MIIRNKAQYKWTANLFDSDLENSEISDSDSENKVLISSCKSP